MQKKTISRSYCLIPQWNAPPEDEHPNPTRFTHNLKVRITGLQVCPHSSATAAPGARRSKQHAHSRASATCAKASLTVTAACTLASTEARSSERTAVPAALSFLRREIGVYWYLFSNHRTGADLKVIQVTPKSAPYCLRCLPGAENLVQH